jgi:hypothetical protein
MAKQPPSLSASQQSRDDAAADSWHDLVAAVVAVQVSPRVCPPAALLGSIERELGFVAARAAWWSASRVLGGMAAALALSLGWLAWRSSASRVGDTFADSSAPAPEVDASLVSSFTPGVSGAVGAAATGVVHAKPAGAAGSDGGKVSAGGAVAASALVAPTMAKQQTTMIAATEAVQSEVARKASEILPGGPGGVGGETSAVAQSTGRIRGTEPFDPKSDFYVVGMIAAALRDPVSANPFESIAQPLEWTDWRSGYEFGVDLPPSETLALSATWTW